MYIDTYIALGTQRWLTGMQAHTHPHAGTFRPGVSGESVLRGYRCGYSVRGTRKSDKEGITPGVYLVAVPALKDVTQQLPALRQHSGVALAQLLEQERGSLDIGEEQCDCACRQVPHNHLLCSTIAPLAISSLHYNIMPDRRMDKPSLEEDS